MKAFLIIILFLFTFHLNSQISINGSKPSESETLDIKKEKKELYIDQWIEDKTPKSNKPKFVEFWATWCGPCIQFLPKFNQLQEEYGDQIDFITISNESLEKVSKFLERREIKGYVALDNNSKTWEEFKITGIPATFLLDKNGILQWQGHPSEIDREKLNKLADGMELPVQKPKVSKTISVQDYAEQHSKSFKANDSLIIDINSKNISLKLTKSVMPLESAGILSHWNKRNQPYYLNITGAKLKDLVGRLKSVSNSRIHMSKSLNKEKYDLVVSSNTLSYENMIENALQLLKLNLGIEIELITSIEEVYLGTIVDENKYNAKNLYSEGNKDAGGKITTSDTSLYLANKSLDYFISQVEGNHNILLDAEFPHENTRFELDLLFENPQDMFNQVEEQIGVRFTLSKKPTKVLKVTKN